MSTLLGLLGFGTDGHLKSAQTRRDSRGFTLVELLVVIAIISILATLLLLQLGVARAKARDAKRIADVNQVRSALELWFDDNGSYLATNVMTGLKTSGYLINIPRDPIAVGCTDTYSGAVSSIFNCYSYAWNPTSAPRSFQVWAELEQRNTNALNNDSDIPAVTSGWTNGNPINGATETCSTSAPNDCIYDSGQP